MFTGIVTDQGRVVRAQRTLQGSRLTIQSEKLASQLAIGDSISINGTCLTVVEADSGHFQVEASPETLRLTNLGELKDGMTVNLEAAARLSDFLGGHLVQGHVDETGEVVSVTPDGNSWIFRFNASADLIKYCTLKGSVTVNGVSLTISGLGNSWFEVAIIPHTFEVTNFSQLQPGDRVNLEADIISKYLESHVKRLMGLLLLIVFLFLVPGPLMAADLLADNAVMVFDNVNARRTNQFVVRVARATPDLVLEWESLSDQGTVHLFQKAVTKSTVFSLMQLYEPGVDQQISREMTLRFSDRMFSDLTSNKLTKLRLNRVPTVMQLEGEETFTLMVDKKAVELPVLKVSDGRGGSWLVLADPDEPLVVQYTTEHFTQRLKSVTHPEKSSLRWIKRLPPVR